MPIVTITVVAWILCTESELSEVLTHTYLLQAEPGSCEFGFHLLTKYLVVRNLDMYSYCYSESSCLHD